MHHTGSCLCGSVKYEVHGKLETVDACHCIQCRKWTGHYLPSVEIKREIINIIDDSHLSWYHSSAKARRGFCGQCGSSLFFDPLDREKNDWIGIAMGSFDEATKAQLNLHIFVAEKGDYYELADGLPQNEY